MKVEDLTIGSWVKVNDIEHTHPLQVAEIFKKCGAYYATLYWDGMPGNVNPETLTADVDKVLPIPLTKEILKKNCGQNNKDVVYQVKPDGLDCAVGGNGYYFYGIIKYVHQLQHALKLCGIEKEIEL